MNEEKVNAIVDAYISSLDEHETPGIIEVHGVLKKDPAKGISATSRAEIGNFVREGLYKKLISQHKWPNGRVPFGYKLDKNQNILVHKTNAKKVKWIFDNYLETRSIYATSHYCAKRLKVRFGAHRIHYMLKNPIYIGVYNVSDETAYKNDLQIIDEKKFLRIQKSLKEHRTRNKPMDPELKRSRVDKVFDEYLKNLDETDDKDLEEYLELVEEIEKPSKPVNKRKRAETLGYESDYLTKMVGDTTLEEGIESAVEFGTGSVISAMTSLEIAYEKMQKAKTIDYKQTRNRVINDAAEIINRLKGDMKFIKAIFDEMKELKKEELIK